MEMAQSVQICQRSVLMWGGVCGVGSLPWCLGDSDLPFIPK